MSRAGLVKRSVSIAGHRTSVSLEEPFWEALAGLARRRGLSVAAVVAAIDRERGNGNLSSALRVAVLSDALSRASAPPGTPDSDHTFGTAIPR